MFRYHIDGELACRDVVSRAIGSEIQASNDQYVYLDCTHLSRKMLLDHFPNIHTKCLSKGIDITKDYIPVAPAAHYLCGGIDVDLRSRTSVKNLYACGECSNTGLHGANRLASNSLLEATVFAHNCVEDISRSLDQIVVPAGVPHSPVPSAGATTVRDLAGKKASLQILMSSFVGIVRSTKGLEHALQELEKMEEEVIADEPSFALPAGWYELRNMITCARLIIMQSLKRKDNRGGFYNKNLAVDEVAL
jgi:L-aspartate oxidase